MLKNCFLLWKMYLFILEKKLQLHVYLQQGLNIRYSLAGAVIKALT